LADPGRDAWLGGYGWLQAVLDVSSNIVLVAFAGRSDATTTTTKIGNERRSESSSSSASFPFTTIAHEPNNNIIRNDDDKNSSVSNTNTRATIRTIATRW
jgi:hypothetical protein